MKNKRRVLFLFFVFVLIAVAVFFRHEIIEKYQTQKRVNHNPYKNFNEALAEKSNQDSVVTPYLRVVGLDRTEGSKQYWTLKTESNETLILIHTVGQCAPLSLATNNLVLVKGRVSYQNGISYIDSNPGYIEYQGKVYCRTDQ